jgi:replicative DNA helicase
LTEQQRLRVVSQMTELAALPIVFADASGPTTDQMKDMIERLNAEREVRLVLFDYIERAGNRKSGNENEENRIGQVAAGLKSIAKDCGVTVVALSQANREVERSASHIPTLSSIRQSGRIEQEADIILGMYRHDYYVSIGLAQPKPESEGIAELHVLKNRDGEQGIVRLRFLPELTAFQNIGGN